MNNLSIIACVSSDLGLGQKNDLLWRIPADQKFFRQTTLGSTVVMGARTFASIGRPLPKRCNYVLTRHPENFNLAPSRDLQFFSTIGALETALSKIQGEVFIIGGASLYQHFLPLANRLLLTEVQATRPADVYFPEFVRDNYIRTVLDSGVFEDNTYEIVEYRKEIDHEANH